MTDNVISLPTKNKQYGINLSFTIQCGTSGPEQVQAQVYLEKFYEAVNQLKRQGFERLTTTVKSVQEYLP